MANSFYPLGLKALLLCQVPDDAVLYACAVDEGYAFNPTHSSGDDLGDTVVLEARELQNVVITGGLVDADDIRYTRPDLTGSVLAGIVVFYGWESDSGGSQLLAFFGDGGTTIPQTLANGDLILQWDSQGIFAIG